MRGEQRRWNIPKYIFPNFSYDLVTGNLKLKLGTFQEELFHLELGWNIPNSVIREL